MLYQNQQMCDLPWDKLDNLKLKYKLCDTWVLKSMFDKNDIAGITGMRKNLLFSVISLSQIYKEDPHWFSL